MERTGEAKEHGKRALEGLRLPSPSQQRRLLQVLASMYTAMLGARS